MKKVLKNFADKLLSKDDLKNVKGGYDSGGGGGGNNNCGPHCIFCWVGPNQMPPLCGTNVCCPSWEEGMQICQHAYTNSIFSSCA